MSASLLIVAALVQLGVLVVGVTLLLLFHVSGSRRRMVVSAASKRLDPPLLAWLNAAEDDVWPLIDFVNALRATPRRQALRFVATTAAVRLSPSRRATLGRAIRNETWVAKALAHLESRRWWERLEAVRLLGVVVAPTDVPRVRELLADPVAAVRLAAADVLPPLFRVGVPGAAPPPEAGELVDQMLTALPGLRRMVGAYHIGVLAQLGPIVVERLGERLDQLASSRGPRRLGEGLDSSAATVWIDVADAIGDQHVLERLCALADHPDVEVRIRVARALRRLYSRGGLDALDALLADGDWRVRAQAARSLGALGALAAVPALASAVGDTMWWVRYRAALALALLGPSGEAALETLRAGPDRMARDMASLVRGLPGGMVTELAEG